MNEAGLARVDAANYVPEPMMLPAKEGLPLWLRRAVAKELCPGERVEAVLRPEPVSARQVVQELPAWALAAGSLPVADWLASATQSDMPWVTPALYGGWVARGLAGLGRRGWQRQFAAYVVTNQRCFRLSLLGRHVRVEDLQAVPPDAGLAAEDVARLQAALEATAEAPRTALRQRVEQALARRARRSVPGWLRSRAERQLEAGEQILWLERPAAIDYVRCAPVDVPTAAIVSVGGFTGILSLVAALLAQFSGPDAAAGAAATLHWALPTTLASTTATALWLRRWLVGTVYVVTDRRAFVLGPGGRLTPFTPEELQQFQRVEDAAGTGNLVARGKLLGSGKAAGFYGVQAVKDLDDLIKQRAVRDRSTEVAPASHPSGRGSELAGEEALGPGGVAR